MSTYDNMPFGMQRMVRSAAQGEPFYICKTPDPKPMDAVLVGKREDIPEQLRHCVFYVERPEDMPQGIQSNLRFTESGQAERYDKAEDKWHQVSLPQILTQAVENDGQYMSWDNSMLIKYETTEKLASGYGAWAKTDWATTTYQDENGGWHNRVKVNQACLIHDGIPSFAEGGKIQQTPDGGYEVQTDWGSISKAKAGEAYLICYGTTKSGTPDLNILTPTEKSADSYSVCTPDGKTLCSFKEFDAAVQERMNEGASTKRRVPDVGLSSSEVQDDTQFD